MNPLRIVSYAGRWLAAALIAVIVVPPMMIGVGAVTLLQGPLPGAELPEAREGFESVPTEVFDATGTSIGVFRDFDRTVEIQWEDVPETVVDAVVSIEDRRFFEHNGVDYEGIARAARINLEVGAVVQGGSTITQQLVKNVYFHDEDTFERKAREALLATELEQELSKQEILFQYLESTYFGAGAYGIGAAAEVYFGKPVSELDYSEAATLAGIIPSPTSWSPRVDAESAERRRLVVLQAMLDEGYLTEQDFRREASRQIWVVDSGPRPSGPVTVVLGPPPNGATAHEYFVDWVVAELLDELGPELVYRGGLRVETTIDPIAQAQAEAAVAARLANTEYPVEMSLVALDHHTGHVVAMVGGRDYAESQVNLATGGSTGFQPGSSFKPIVLAAAFRRAIGPETVYPAPAAWVVPGCSGTQCTISNYDHADRGDISLRAATAASVNTVFAQLVMDVGIDSTVELARDLGLERLDPNDAHGPSVALGAAESSPLEMASAYGTFANSGVRVAPTGIARVVDRDGNVLIDNRAPVGSTVLSPMVADNVTSVLQDVVTDGTAGRASLGGRPVAGKTGTTQNYWGAWFVGYTPQLTTAVWMGHADGLASLYGINGVARVTGGSHPAIAFSDFMRAAHEGIEVVDFPEPVELVAVAESDDVVAAPLAQTVVGGRTTPTAVAGDCGGPCRLNSLARPSAGAPITTTTTAPSTSSTDPTNPTVSTPTPSSTTSTTDAAPVSTTVPDGGNP